jgi:hydroxymethylbilane synthase
MAALKLGTRGSKLALTQAGLVRDALARSVPALAAADAIEIVVIRRRCWRVASTLPCTA